MQPTLDTQKRQLKALLLKAFKSNPDELALAYRGQVSLRHLPGEPMDALRPWLDIVEELNLGATFQHLGELSDKEREMYQREYADQSFEIFVEPLDQTLPVYGISHAPFSKKRLRRLPLTQRALLEQLNPHFVDEEDLVARLGQADSDAEQQVQRALLHGDVLTFCTQRDYDRAFRGHRKNANKYPLPSAVPLTFLKRVRTSDDRAVASAYAGEIARIILEHPHEIRHLPRQGKLPFGAAGNN